MVELDFRCGGTIVPIRIGLEAMSPTWFEFGQLRRCRVGPQKVGFWHTPESSFSDVNVGEVVDSGT